MTKVDLISAVADKADVTKKLSEQMVNTFFDVITEKLAEGEKIVITGFGTFEVKSRPERQGNNPRTKEPMTIAASKAPSFKAGKGLKEAVNK